VETEIVKILIVSFGKKDISISMYSFVFTIFYTKRNKLLIKRFVYLLVSISFFLSVLFFWLFMNQKLRVLEKERNEKTEA
jgi:hypothetical protein